VPPRENHIGSVGKTDSKLFLNERVEHCGARRVGRVQNQKMTSHQNEGFEMKAQIATAILGLILTPALGTAQSAFNGTWRPDPQRPGPGEKPTVVELIEGHYECKSCAPPYNIKSDGHDQPIPGVPYYDTLSVTVVDQHTVLKTAKKGGQTVAEIKDAVSADGRTMVETQTVVGMAPRPFEFAKQLTRMTAGHPHAHLISGEWRLVEEQDGHRLR
jgi:hypothetical protein